MAADAITAFLFAAQAHQASAVLFVIYIMIATVGFREWLLKYRQQAPSIA
jgi:nicotinamide riboside transporter PnuC